MNNLLTNDNPIQDLLLEIYDKSKGLYKKEKTPRALETSLNKLSKILKLKDKLQSLVISLIYKHQIEDEKATLKKIAEHLDCKVSELVNLSSHFNFLHFTGQIDKVNSNVDGKSYEITSRLYYALMFNNIKQYHDDNTITGIVSFFSSIDLITNSLVSILKDKSTVNVDEYYEYYISYFNSCLVHVKNESFIKKINKIQYPNDFSKMILIYLVYCYTFQGMNAFNISKLLYTMFPAGEYLNSLKAFFTNKSSVLSHLGYIEPIKSDFKNGNIKLTKKFIEKFISSEEALSVFVPETNVENSDLINPNNIKKKELYYNEKEKNKVDILKNAFSNDNLENLMEKLDSTGFNKGMTVLFHGYPGTGKTETAMQIAKHTNRKVFQVDFSEIKDMYVGNSEKNVKAIFDTYYEYMDRTQEVPILLFNEADSVISKRTDSVRNSTDQMHNTIQNILLQELENFRGIMIATTNLIDNIDNAFDRRILYKIEFNKPDVSNRMKMWKNRNKWLTKTNSRKVSEMFDFTGGQIENVTKKYVIDTALKGEDDSFETLLTYCEEEEFRKNVTSTKKTFNGF